MSAVLWTNQISRLGTTGLPTKLQCLYLSVAMPRITYATNVWYTPVAPSTWNPCTCTRSVRIAQKLNSVQQCTLITLSGALCSTASNILKIHSNILPMHLTTEHAAALLFDSPLFHPLIPSPKFEILFTTLYSAVQVCNLMK